MNLEIEETRGKEKNRKIEEKEDGGKWQKCWEIFD